MNRDYISLIRSDLGKKIIILSGPRQCGKTTLSKMLNELSFVYLNFDSAKDRESLRQQVWDRDAQLLILDEIHKMKSWKRWLKGIYDTEGLKPAIVVTGSAQLESYRKVGDSLAGRYFHYRLHPIDVKEALHVDKSLSASVALQRIWDCSGFPEPFFDGRASYYKKWRKTHVDVILKQDLISLETVRGITQIESLIEMMKSRVGVPLSFSSLSEDLQVSDKTVKNWLNILENLYIVFKVTPFHKNMARSLLKKPKFYFFDSGLSQGGDGSQFENIVACALLKEIHWRNDTQGENYDLHYVQTKDRQEIDFLVTKNAKPCQLIEVKLSDAQPTRSFYGFGNVFKDIPKVQLVLNLSKKTSYPGGIRIEPAAEWLAKMPIP